MRRILSASLIAATSIIFSSCAFVDNEIQLEYQTVSTASVPSKNAGTIYMSLLKDERADKTKVGVVRNAYGMETAKVLTSDNPTIWVSNTLKGNLERSGYKVETVAEGFSPSRDQFYLSGSLMKVHSDPQMGFWTVTVRGDIEAFLHAQFGGQRTQSLIAGRSETESLVSTGGDLHKGVLNAALSDFVTKVLAWLQNLKT